MEWILLVPGRTFLKEGFYFKVEASGRKHTWLRKDWPEIQSKEEIQETLEKQWHTEGREEKEQERAKDVTRNLRTPCSQHLHKSIKQDSYT